MTTSSWLGFSPTCLSNWPSLLRNKTILHHVCYDSYQARALRALGLLLTDSALTVGWGKTFWRFGLFFLWKQVLLGKKKSWKIDPNRPFRRGLQTSHRQNLGSYIKKQIYGPKSELLGPPKRALLDSNRPAKVVQTKKYHFPKKISLF